MTTSNYTQVLYYSSKSKIPTIIKPKGNSFWQSSRDVPFSWVYNGFDIQLEYQIQVYPFDVKENDIPDEWFTKITEDDDDVSGTVGSPVVDLSITSPDQSRNIDFSAISPLNTDDGSYLWRLRTRGNVANEWSDWNTEGRVNLDSVAPIIRNAVIESPTSYNESNEPAMASYISDMSMPYVFSRRVGMSGTVTDRHIDRDGNEGLFIYYDYRDNSITLRASRGSATTTPRFYGLISFHNNEDELVPDFNVQSAIKAAYMYKINRDSADGPFEQTRYTEHSADDLVGDSIEKLLYTDNEGTGTSMIPRGFPSFWNGTVYSGFSNHTKHPAGFDRAKSFFSQFPFSTRVVTRTLTFPVAGPTGIDQTQTFTNVIELRYPVPYQDLFILFDTGMSNILAYGQYKTEDLPETLEDSNTFDFVLKRGLDVRSWVASDEDNPAIDSNIRYQFFEENATTQNLGETAFQDNPKQRNGFQSEFGDQIKNGLFRSYNLFFNLNGDSDFDHALKIYLRPEALTVNGASDVIDSSDNSIQVSFIDFTMSPESDCVFSGLTPSGTTTRIDRVYLGRAKVSPKGLSYSDRNPLDKNILVDPKVATIPYQKESDLTDNDLFYNVRKWGCDNSIINFTHDRDSYNGSFRLKVPQFKYVPYYHPGGINYSDTPTNSQPPIPHIFDSDPNQDADDVIGWDRITLETKTDSGIAREAVPQSDLVYNGDYIRFMGTARALGQANPFFYNFENWSASGVPRGTISRVRDDGPFQPFMLNPDEYLYDGDSMFEDGWHHDGTIFNAVDRGLYSIGTLNRNVTSTTTEIFMVNFSAYLFRRSLEAANKSSFLSTDEYSEDLFAEDEATDSTLFENSILDFTSGSSTNGKAWIYSLADDSPDNFKNALIRDDDLSVQGHFGLSGEPDPRWLEDTSNPFGGYYLIETDSDTDTATQVKRIISISGNNFNYTLMSPLDRFTIDTAPTGARTLTMTGDTFSMGNVFGNVIPNENNKLRIFFDVDEPDAGIKEVKVYQVDLETAPINVGEDNPNTVESSQYIGPLNTSLVDTKLQILMQKVNNRVFTLTDATSRNNALAILKTSRSPESLVQYHFDNNITLWEQAETATRTCVDASSGTPTEVEVSYTSDDAGFFHEITATGNGLKLFFIQVRDRSGNVSNLFPISSFIPGAGSVEPANVIKSANVSVDDGQVVRDITSTTIGLTTYQFEEHLLPVDTDKSRSIVIKKMLVDDNENPGEYRNITNVNDMVAGFSDNYGLSFNIYSPVSSINTWRFTRPFAIRQKSYNKETREKEPTWYFDPNHVRHYTTDKDDDFSGFNFSVGSNDLQVNNSTGNITLLGFEDDSPFSDVLKNFKDELVGKTLKLGNAMDQSFTILHIFEDTLVSISKTDLDNNIDSLTTAKTWIVVDDPDAICALIASRKFQYIRNTGDSKFNDAKQFTYKNSSSEFNSGVYTNYFGYLEDESAISSDINDLVNEALKMDGNIVTTGNDPNSGPIANIPGSNGSFNEGELSIYILPNSALSDSSGITTNEGWTTQIYQAFRLDSSGNRIDATGINILDNLTHRQLTGLKVYNALNFGENVVLQGTIDSATFVSGLGGTVLVLDGVAIDEPIAGLTYTITNETTSNDVSITNPNIVKASKTGDAVVVEDDITSLLSLGSNTYSFKVTLTPVDSTDTVTGNLLPDGWWPSIGGLAVPPLGNRLGTVGVTNSSARQEVDFAAISSGAFFIPESGDYLFEIEIDTGLNTYADFSVDFLNTDQIIEDLIETISGIETKNIGGFFSTNAVLKEQTFYLTKGWHVGRFRYVSQDPSNGSSARVKYSKADWNDTSLRVPMTGDNSSRYSFLSRAFHSIVCKIQDQDFTQIYPDENASATSASQFCRAVLGFIRQLEDISASTTVNQVALIERSDSEPEFGERINATLAEASPTFGGQIYEEAYGIYISNIFDGGSDFRFWRTISWSPTPGSQPDGTSVEVEIRTGETESELLSSEWNSITNSDGSTTILPVFTIPGSDIIKFSFEGDPDDPDSLKLKQFIQFRLTLKSSERGITPTVDDVTITFSKQNTVNFFTNTFNLSSNMLRAILVYNGEEPVDPNGVALAELQFGLSTTEVTDGVVSTNFDDFTLINPNEVFSLTNLNIPENDKFRIGVKFIASSEEVPVLDEMAILWESEDINNPDKLNDFS